MADQYFTYGTPGIGSVGSYQMAGHPYVSGSEALGAGEEDRHSFGTVAKSITLTNHGGHALRIHYASTGSMNTPATTHHFMTLSGSGTTLSLPGRSKDVYVSNNTSTALAYEIYAELTSIDAGEMLTLTGSGVSS